MTFDRPLPRWSESKRRIGTRGRWLLLRDSFPVGTVLCVPRTGENMVVEALGDRPGKVQVSRGISGTLAPIAPGDDICWIGERYVGQGREA